MLHYHLSILMFVDIIEATGRYDLLVKLGEASTEAENIVMNCFVFGLHNEFSLSLSSERAADSEMSPPSTSSDEVPVSSISVPLVSIDPYPHHVVAGVQLLRKAIDRDYRLGKIEDDTYASLQSTLERTLDLLPRTSQSVEAARMKLRGASACESLCDLDAQDATIRTI